MINWDEYQYNQDICLRILNEGTVNEISVKLLEYGWHQHGRIRITAIVQITKSDDEDKWPISAKIELPIKTEGNIEFIMIESKPGIPRFKSIRRGEVVSLCDLN